GCKHCRFVESLFHNAEGHRPAGSVATVQQSSVWAIWRIGQHLDYGRGCRVPPRLRTPPPCPEHRCCCCGGELIERYLRFVGAILWLVEESAHGPEYHLAYVGETRSARHCSRPRRRLQQYLGCTGERKREMS